jgi:hypothetical protein
VEYLGKGGSVATDRCNRGYIHREGKNIFDIKEANSILISQIESVHRERIKDEHMLCDRLIRKLHNWQIGAVAAFLGGLVIGMTVVGISYTNAAQ